MEESHRFYCSLLDQKNQDRFLCYTGRKNGVFTICWEEISVRVGYYVIKVTVGADAADVWSTEFTEDTLKQLRQRCALKSTEDYILKLRSACGRGEVSVVVQDSSAELQMSSSPGDLSVTLSRLEGAQTTEELKELLFTMADSLTTPDRKCGSSSVSPVKTLHRRPTEFEPQQQQNGSSSVTLTRRLPGASLINPGTKTKRQAMGVAFDDIDED